MIQIIHISYTSMEQDLTSPEVTLRDFPHPYFTGWYFINEEGDLHGAYTTEKDAKTASFTYLRNQT